MIDNEEHDNPKPARTSLNNNDIDSDHNLGFTASFANANFDNEECNNSKPACVPLSNNDVTLDHNANMFCKQGVKSNNPTQCLRYQCKTFVKEREE